MKKILLTLCVIILLTQCNTHESSNIKDSKIKIQVKIYNKIDSVSIFGQKGNLYDLCGQKGNLYSIGIGITNNTDTVFQFWTMNCSWEDNWISTKDSFNLFCPGCTNNHTIIEKIEPGKTIFYKGLGRVLEPLNALKSKDFKLGLVLVKKNEYDIHNLVQVFYEILSIKKESKKDIIWSEPIKIDK